MKKFEYICPTFPVNEHLQIQLEALGKEGWEMVSAFPVPGELENISYYRYHFKKEIIEKDKHERPIKEE